MELQIHSRGLYSTFVLIPDFNLMFDAGEGVAAQIGPPVTSLRKIFLSHAHTDHIMGLPTLLNIRGRHKDVEPIQIFYPKDTRRIENLRAFIGDMRNVEWIAIDEGAEIEVQKNLFVRAFATTHIPSHAGHGSLGYSLIERRTRRRSEFASLNERDIASAVRDASDRGEKLQINEACEKTLVVYTGDTGPLPESTMQAWNSPDILIHDATYILDEDSENERHSTVSQAERARLISGAHQLIGFHLSVRYQAHWKSHLRTLSADTWLIPPDGELHRIDTTPIHAAAKIAMR